jgi:hypothetical protein
MKVGIIDMLSISRGVRGSVKCCYPTGGGGGGGEGGQEEGEGGGEAEEGV